MQIFAYEQSEKYKEGKFIIERAYITKVQFNANNSLQTNNINSTKDDNRLEEVQDEYEEEKEEEIEL